jgi:hypothetical protein
MKRIECIALGLTVALAGWTCSAQENPIPFERLHHDAELQTYFLAAAADGNSSSSAPAASSSTTGFVYARPSPSVPRPVVTKSYFLLNGLHLGMALADVEMTQHCIANHRCKEGNPMMPSSEAGQIGINVGIFAYAAGSSYWLKKHKSPIWWMPPAVGIVAHTIGVASGLRFR